jgi:spermidine/putrescine transport system permease protein
MVFLPTLAGFAIPKILSKGQILFIGNIIESKFINTNYNHGSLLAVVILIFILGSIFLLTKFDKEGETLL